MSYWDTEESIRNWKNHGRHLVDSIKAGLAGTVIIMSALHRSKENMNLIEGKDEIKKLTYNIKLILKNIDRCL